jgi:hypothetical protein
LQCVLASLEHVNIIIPYATLINLPEDVPHPRKTLLLLLNFIETITFFNQFQREKIVNEKTAEVFIKTAPEDIELAFKLLKNSLFRRADELSTSARGFYNWLQNYLKEAQTTQFTALDIRKAKRMHPRTLNRYLQELALFNYIQITGGNKYREGYRYKITNLNEDNSLNIGIENALKATLDNVIASAAKQEAKRHCERSKASETAGQPPQTNTKTIENTNRNSRTTKITKNG